MAHGIESGMGVLNGAGAAANSLSLCFALALADPAALAPLW